MLRGCELVLEDACARSERAQEFEEDVECREGVASVVGGGVEVDRYRWGKGGGRNGGLAVAVGCPQALGTRFGLLNMIDGRCSYC